MDILKKHRNILLLSLILISSLILRLYNLSSVPASISQDEAVNGYDALSLGLTLKDHHGNFLPILLESFGDWVSPVLTYITIPFVKLFGLSIFSIRLPVVLFSVGSIFLMYILILKIFKDQPIALIAAFFIAIAPWSITISRFAIPPSIVPFFLLLSINIFYFALNDKRKSSYFKFSLFILSISILTYSYPTQKVYAPLMFLLLLIIYLRKRIVFCISLSFSYFILISPLYLLILINPSKFNSRFNAVSLASLHGNILVEFLKRYVIYLSPYFSFGRGDSDITHHVLEVGSYYPFLAILFYLGVIFTALILIRKIELLKEKRNDILFFFLLLLLSPVPASLTVDYNHLLRAIQLLPIIIIFCSFSLFILKSRLNKVQLNIVYILLIILSFVSLLNFLNIYFNNYKNESKSAFQYGLLEAMSYVVRNQSKYSKIYIDVKGLNQSYIYYLFEKNNNTPQKIEKDFIHTDDVKNIDNLIFTNSIPDLHNAVYRVKDYQGRVWFVFYVRSNNLYLEKESNKA